MLIRSSVRGFTIVEMMVGLVIVGLLLAIGGPAFGTFLQNARLGTAARSFYTGIQMARTEAIRLNLPVEFVLTDTPVDSSVAVNAISSVAGRNWVVRYQDPAASTPTLVEAKSSLENGGNNMTLQILSSTDVIGFNGVGGTTTGNAQTIDISNPSGGLCTPAGPMRCWRLQVSVAGQVRLCDPDPSVVAGDSRACY